MLAQLSPRWFAFTHFPSYADLIPPQREHVLAMLDTTWHLITKLAYSMFATHQTEVVLRLALQMVCIYNYVSNYLYLIIFSWCLLLRSWLYTRSKWKNLHAETRYAFYASFISLCLIFTALNGHHCVNTDPVIICSSLGATALVLQGVLTDTISLWARCMEE